MRTPKIITPTWIRQGKNEKEWHKQQIRNRLLELLKDENKVNVCMELLDKKISISP